MQDLQSLLIWAKNKQMILVERNNSQWHNLKDHQEEFWGNMDKRHHPILILSKTATTTTSQSIVCRGASEAISINHFTDRHWVLPTKSYSHDLER